MNKGGIIKVIYAVWIINKDGLPLLTRNYSKFRLDSALFSGFVTAIYNFTQEMGGGKLREITMDGTKLLLYPIESHEVFCVLMVSASDNTAKYLTFFERIEKEILNRHELSQHPSETREVAVKVLDKIVDDYKSQITLQDLANIPLLKDFKVQMLLAKLLSQEITEISPDLDSSNVFGCRYKYVETVMETDNFERIMLILNNLADVGILIRKEYETIVACPICGAIDVHTAYRCPECKSMKVKPSRLIHHKDCNYIGPAEFFVATGGLVCPSCEKPLYRKGQDYDVVEGFQCMKCHYIAEKFEQVYHCFKCNNKFPLNQAEERVIYSYILNPDVREDLKTYLTREAISPQDTSWTIENIEIPKSVLADDKETQEILKQIEEYKNKLKEIEELWKKGQISPVERDNNYIKLRIKIRELIDKLKKKGAKVAL